MRVRAWRSGGRNPVEQLLVDQLGLAGSLDRINNQNGPQGTQPEDDVGVVLRPLPAVTAAPHQFPGSSPLTYRARRPKRFGIPVSDA
ncbi:hypothetical protein [Kribbella sp. NPDC023855]|uniref:hypothetical protein n=1 Tax=Kribbella sp. NPDC023855 TaxID=3154698 RepID=UPI0033C5C63E